MLLVMREQIITQFLDEPQYSHPDKARVVIIPAPLEYTVSYVQGTRHGPQAILNASSQLELYDEELECSPLEEVGIYTRPALDYRGLDHASALRLTGEAVREVLERGQFPLVIGGEHSLSLQPIAVAREFFPDLTVIHIDAHGDLRGEYTGSAISHACIARRVLELGIPVLELGIRSISAEEIDFLRGGADAAIVWARDLVQGQARIPWERLSEHTYVTFDLDALDPAEMPAVGTPEPGGLSWYQALALVREICRRTTVVALDVVELCPIPGQIRADFLAARLIYKMIGYRFAAQRRTE
ncbi:agmatinase [Thermogemmatispora sp.]|uniref:agmatinase n=1 Tax=Thermogemmatispora sp. TaxID=1968838 RepID=UPI0035E3F599